MSKAKYVIFSLFLFSISITIINCSDNPVSVVDTSDFRYPFTNGDRWSYERTITISDIRPDSILHYFLKNPVIITGTVRILYDTVINFVLTKCFLDEFESEGMTTSNRYYYINNDTALILYYVRGYPANGLLPLNLIKNSNSLSSVIKNSIYENSDNYSNQGDSFFIPLRYPVVAGTEWSFNNSFAGVTGKYLGFENVTTPSGTVSCMKEETTYSAFPDDPIYNYYSKYGLMKRIQFMNDITISTITSPKGIGIIDINDETEILSYNVRTN